jgi:hypothetical protein
MWQPSIGKTLMKSRCPRHQTSNNPVRLVTLGTALRRVTRNPRFPIRLPPAKRKASPKEGQGPAVGQTSQKPRRLMLVPNPQIPTRAPKAPVLFFRQLIVPLVRVCSPRLIFPPPVTRLSGSTAQSAPIRRATHQETEAALLDDESLIAVARKDINEFMPCTNGSREAQLIVTEVIHYRDASIEICVNE